MKRPFFPHSVVRCFRWARNCFAILGAIVFVISGSCLIDDLSDAARRRWIVQGPPISPTAQKLAGKIAPRLTELAETYEPQFIRNAGGLVARSACRIVYPHVVKEIPTACEAGVNDLLDHFGTLSLGELARDLAAHAAFRGHDIHPSIAREAGR